MKKTVCLILVLLLTVCAPAAGFAADNYAMVFTGDEIQLSLEDAKTKMLESGAPIETANINRKNNQVMTRTSYEDEMKTEETSESGLYMVSRTLREMADLRYEFAKEQTQRNYDAELNQIIRDTVENYYNMAHVKEALRVSEENVAIQEKLYKNTQSKFELGVVSRQDVLLAEIGLNEARVNAEKAKNGYDSVRMGFNVNFGYGLMQNVTITDTLEEVPVSEISLNEAINLALANRNEIRGAAYGVQLAELSVKEYSAYPRSSAVSLNASAALFAAQTANANAPKGIEMDVRTKYMNMHQKKSELELGKMNVANAKETYRLATLQYDAGMTTLTDTQQAQLVAYNAELAYYTTLLEYNLAIIDYEQAATVGTSSVNI